MTVDEIHLPAAQPELTGPGVRLRPWREDDVPAMVAAGQDPLTVRFTSVPEGFTPDQARRLVHGTYPAAYENASAATFAVVDPDDGTLLGLACLIRLALAAKRAEVGYWVAPWARGRGVAVAATTAVVEWAFGLGFERLELLAEPENTGSLAVAARCGFRVEGVLREYSEIKGARRDLVMHSLLQREWSGPTTT